MIPENSCASSVSVVLPEIPPTKIRFGTRVPYLGALLLLLLMVLCCGCEMCVLVVTRFTDEAGDEEVVDPSVLPVLADDWNYMNSPVNVLTSLHLMTISHSSILAQVVQGTGFYIK
jgi:hypothetical protein